MIGLVLLRAITLDPAFYAKGATGNVATEDVVYMLNGMGIKTGIDLKKLIHAGRYISAKLGRLTASRVNRACSD